MLGKKIGNFCEQLLVRNTGITVIHVLNGVHEIDSNLAALILKYIERMVHRDWRLHFTYLMRTPGEDMRLQWTFWNLVNIGGIAGAHIFGEHLHVRDIQQYAGNNKWERIDSLLTEESKRISRPLRLICVCTGNVDRSPLVEAYLKCELAQMGLDEAICVESRGIWPREGRPASPPTVKVASELGIDLTAHCARRLMRKEVEEADLILAMKEKHYEAVLKLDPTAAERTMVLNIDDPGTELYLWEDTERYRDVLMQVRNAVKSLLKNLEKKTDLIRCNLQLSRFKKQLAIVDHFDELRAHGKELEGRALLIADDVLQDKDQITQPSFMPQQSMGIIALSLLSVVGQPHFANLVTKAEGVFLFKRVPRLTPPW